MIENTETTQRQQKTFFGDQSHRELQICCRRLPKIFTHLQGLGAVVLRGCTVSFKDPAISDVDRVSVK